VTAWVYKQVARATENWADMWVVGYYDPDGVWEPESDHVTAEAAAARVHYLNGGDSVPRDVKP
jgi:hypothetical protein